MPRHSRLLFVFTACLAAWLVTQSTAAQDMPPNWQPLSGPAGRITQITGRADGAELYAASITAVNRREDQTQWFETGALARADAIYGSFDNGSTWHPLTNDLPPGPISALYADATNDQLYAAVQSAGDDAVRRAGLWLSTNHGQQWRQLPLGRDDLVIRRIARGANSYLYIGAVDAGPSPNSYVYRLSDAGTWTAVQVLRFEQRPSSLLADLILHPSIPTRLFITTYGGDLFISDDSGQTWALSGAPNAQFETGSSPAQLAIRPDRPEIAVLARGGGAGGIAVERSTDGGQTWRAVMAAGLPAQGGLRALVALRDGIFLLNTAAGTYRSTDEGTSWQPLEGALNSGGVSQFLVPTGASAQGKVVLAATGYGLFISRDAGAVWTPLDDGLPFNSKIAGLLTHPNRSGQIFAISDNRWLGGSAAPPVLLRSLDGGKLWTPAASGLPDVPVTAWAGDPNDPNTLFLAAWDYVARSTDAGVSWRLTRLPQSKRTALVVAPSEPKVAYLAGEPAMRTTDRGDTWQELIAPNDAGGSAAAITALTIDAAAANHLWAGTDRGVYESRDGGRTWQPAGLTDIAVRWLAALPDGKSSASAVAGPTLFAGGAQGIYRRQPNGAWVGSDVGLPAESALLAFAVDPRSPGVLWVARDGGGVYRSTDNGLSWSNAGVGVGDNLAQALAIDYSTPGGALLGSATAGVWSLSSSRQPASAATAPSTPQSDELRIRTGVDARIEIVWPHDWAPVEQASQANLGLRLFMPGSLLPPSCGWQPRVQVWQAIDTAPAEPLGQAVQRNVAGQPFPYWERNDINVSAANNPARKLYFFVRVEGVDTATSVWAHGSDPRTYFPQQDVPSGLAAGVIDAVDTRIQIVWPHDETGAERNVAEASLANVAVAIFKHGTRLSMPPDWQPTGLTLYGAWNQEVAKPLATTSLVHTRQAGAITFPVWEFTNLPVARAIDPNNKLYLWVMIEGLQTYPTIWAHGADSRTFFPAKDEPIQGCVP